MTNWGAASIKGLSAASTASISSFLSSYSIFRINLLILPNLAKFSGLLYPSASFLRFSIVYFCSSTSLCLGVWGGAFYLAICYWCYIIYWTIAIGLLEALGSAPDNSKRVFCAYSKIFLGSRIVWRSASAKRVAQRMVTGAIFDIIMN
jgi:hypothetical protein